MNAAFSLQVEQSLRNLGFTRHEVKALVYLVRVKKCTAKKLSREATIPFNMAQAILTNLERRGLVCVKNNGSSEYVFCGKESFNEWLKEERNKHHHIYEQAGKDMEQLFETAEENQWQPEVLFYEGAKGIQEIYDDILQTGEDIFTCTDLRQAIDILGQDYVSNIVEKLVEKNVKIYSIRSKSANEVLSESYGMPADDLLEVKVSKAMKLNGEIKIYGNKSALITFENDKPVGFVFVGGPTAKLMKQFFKTLWDSTD